MKTKYNFDELNVLTYEYTDKIIKYMAKQVFRIFDKYRVYLIYADSRDVYKYSKQMYDELYTEVWKAYYKLYSRVYKDNGGLNKPKRDWVEEYLFGYSPVMEVVFSHEYDRKEARFAESVLASDDRQSAIDKGMRIITRMINQGAIEVTDTAALKAYTEPGAIKVVWYANQDERTCRECMMRDKKVYSIDKIPRKHPNCRCWLKPATPRIL